MRAKLPTRLMPAADKSETSSLSEESKESSSDVSENDGDELDQKLNVSKYSVKSATSSLHTADLMRGLPSNFAE